MGRTARTPAYRTRKGYSQAIVTLTDAVTRKRKDYWLGEYGSAQSRELYHRLVAAWEASGRRLPNLAEAGVTAEGEAKDATPGNDGPTVTTVIAAYWDWAREYYQPTEANTLRVGLRLLRSHYGSTPAESFGPKRLRALRESMIDGDPNAEPPREPWSRTYVNQHVQRLRRMFKWAASQELISAAVPRGLETVENLKRGRTRAKEGAKVLPVPESRIEAVRPFLNRQVEAVVDLQLLTGARPGEILSMRPCDIETGGGVWRYRPCDHKTAHRGDERVIYLGPRSQEVVSRFLDRPTASYLFSPAEAEVARRAALTAQRVTPIHQGNSVGTHRKEAPQKQPGDRYTTASYAGAIRTACDRAFPPPGELGKQPRETTKQWLARLTPEQTEALAAWRAEHRWHPHQLRHNAATSIRAEFGLEAAQLMLGHSSALVTDAVYAERDAAKVEAVVRSVG